MEYVLQRKERCTEFSIHNEHQLCFKRINRDGGALHCFQLDVHFVTFKIRETSKWTQDLTVESCALYSSSKISMLADILEESPMN